MYGSSTSLSADIFTKWPRIKYTPCAIDTLHPVAVAPTSIKVATVSPELIKVFP